MKKIFFIFAVVMMFGFTTSLVLAAKPVSTCATIQSGSITDVSGNPIGVGYDKWGYNYEAHMFNGFYDNYSRPSTPVTSGDSLMMKWNDAWLSNKDCNGDGKLDRPTSYIGSGAWLTNHASGTYPNPNWNVNTATNTIHIPWANTDYQYSVTFSQSGTVLTGTLTDGYYPTSGSLNGTIVGNHVVFTFAYPNGSVQGVRTYDGIIDSYGNISGTWSETGSENASGTWSISNFATQVNSICEWSDFVKIVAVPNGAVMDGENWTLNGTVIGPAIWGDFAIIQEVSSNPCGNDLGLMNYKSQLRSGLGNW